MALTRDFKDTVRARVQTDPEFREALLKEGLEAMRSGADTAPLLMELICVFSPSDIEELRDTEPRCAEPE
ncbi:Hypothetical protein HEAR2209 [Herminiimonas arsenicoxydans]|uniref:Uncharacterized protein n=1 Tax=Herminiimonas arsenicoxydans TaxID=204773 RepID=A4G757_HERAR|nr:Hypothetical protein HEAR2209 [Herminiimonas arsenicoxydans]